MEQLFYEKNENFKPVYDTAMALLKERGHEEICTPIVADVRWNVEVWWLRRICNPPQLNI